MLAHLQCNICMYEIKTAATWIMVQEKNSLSMATYSTNVLVDYLYIIAAAVHYRKNADITDIYAYSICPSLGPQL